MSEEEDPHEAFCEGFRDALPSEHRDHWQAHYAIWRESLPLNDVELIDLEGLGYVTGLEAGHVYSKKVLRI